MPRKKKETLKRRKDGRFKCKYKDKQFYGNSPEEAFLAREQYKMHERSGFSTIQTVAEYSLPWLRRTFPTVAKSTYAGLAVHLQHLIDEIGDKRIADVVPSDIKSVYTNQYLNCSSSYMKSARQLYTSLFDSAVADGICRSNPARDRTAKPHQGKQPTTRTITQQERQWIETLCTDHRCYPAVMAMLYAGLRPQEMKAIIIERDVDFEHDLITIHETAHADGQKYRYTGQGKTANANRTIPLFPPLKKALEGRTGYIIASAGGKRVTPTTWRVVWNSYKCSMETAINGIQKRWFGRTKEQQQQAAAGRLTKWIDFDIVPYDLRHAFCVMCRDAGIEMNTCRKWLGHADAKMILSVYDSVSEDRSEQERKKVENRLFGVQNGVQENTQQPGTCEE